MAEGPKTSPDKDSRHEYADERDMDRFWEVAHLDREPAKQWWYIPLILGLILVSIPWFGARVLETEATVAPSSNSQTIIMGLPLWIWIPIGCTLALSIVTSFAVLRFWRDGDSDSD